MSLLNVPSLKPDISIIGTNSMFFVKLGMNGMQLMEQISCSVFIVVSLTTQCQLNDLYSFK
jgi:hypothetical protein